MQILNNPADPSAGSTPPAPTMYLILYPQSFEQDVIDLLDGVGVPGFTLTPKVVGRGPRGQHFDTQVWPGADGMIYTFVAAEQADALSSVLTSFGGDLEQRSHRLFGLHVFTWPCHQLI